MSAPTPMPATWPPKLQPEAKSPNNRVYVVGLPAAGTSELGQAALQALASAEVVIGSWRQLNLLDDANQAEKKPWPSPLVPSVVPMFEQLRGRNVVVLASGDPMFHGIGTTLHRLLQDWQIVVLPHASSAAIACARLGWAVEHTPVLSLTTNPVEHLAGALLREDRFLVLGTDESSPGAICTLARELGIHASVAVLSDLGSADEQHRLGTTEQPPEVVSSLNIIALDRIERPRTLSLAPGLDDACFEHDGQITKRHIRALTVSELRPKPDEHLWDIGGGSGSVSIECLRLEPRLHATIFEANEARRARIAHNAATLGVADRLTILGAAPVHFTQAEEPNVVFIGGGLTAPGMIEAIERHCAAGTRVVANAVTQESLAVLLALRARLGGRLSQFGIATEKAVGTFHAMQPALSITQWSATINEGH